jgi:protoporphyrinogen oxidase
LGIDDQLRFRETRMGFYHNGSIYSMNSVVEFLRFPPLGWIDRFRLGLTVLGAQFVRDWRQLEGVSVQDWLMRWSGQRTYENIWRPMLKAKFDGNYADAPATWIWSRLVRMKSTRTAPTRRRSGPPDRRVSDVDPGDGGTDPGSGRQDSPEQSSAGDRHRE